MKSFKSYISEASRIKAEDFEASIVIGWYEITDKEYSLNNVGVSEAQMNLLEENPEVLEAGKRIAEFILRNTSAKRSDKAEVFGRASTSLTSFWKQYGATNKTPKTDILIGDLRLSLKIGNAQLMSGGRAESLATFNAALEESKNLEKSPQVKKVVDIIESFVERGMSPGKIAPLIGSGENQVIDDGESAHKMAMQELGNLFEESEEFKIQFAREAMSGFKKFGEDSLAAAEYMLVSTHDGKNTQIHSVYDDAYCKSIAEKMRLQARFKSSSRKLKGKKTGEYNFWSVISLIVNAMDEAPIEENAQQLDEFRAFRKAVSFLKKKLSPIVKKIKGVFRSGVKSIVDFMGVTPNINVNNNINFRK